MDTHMCAAHTDAEDSALHSVDPERGLDIGMELT